MSVVSVLEESGKGNRLVFKFAYFILTALLLFVLILAITIGGEGGTDFEKGYIVGTFLGHAMWIGILSYLVHRFLLRKRKGFGLLVFLTTLLIVSSIRCVHTVRERNDMGDLMNSMAELMRSVSQGQPVDSTLISGKRLHRYAPVMKFTANYYRDIQSQFGSTLLNLEDCYRGALEPTRLADPSEIDKSRAKLMRADTLIRQFESYFESTSEKAIQEMDSVARRVGLKQSFVNGFRDGTQASRARFDQLMAIHRLFALNTDSLLAFMSERRGTFESDSSGVVFATQEDADRYNLFVTRVNGLIAAEQEWRASRFDEVQEKVSQLGGE